MFEIIKKSKISNARLGIIKTLHGNIETPFFMPDATSGLVKNLSNQDLADLGINCLVVNTLHLFLRPGVKIIKQARGWRQFIKWPSPILSDSGGYQIYSLIHKSKNGVNGSITDAGACFRSPLNGVKLKLTPEQSIKTQFDLGVDLMVCLDDCPPNNYDDAKLEIAVQRTLGWAKRCWLEYNKQLKLRRLKNKRPLIIAVIQGGNNLALRETCAKELIKIGFDGFGFGARHIDESGNFLTEALKATAEQIPEAKLRFGLGIGLPEDIIRSVKMGWDMFDCVIPTREGRHGRLFLFNRRAERIRQLTDSILRFYRSSASRRIRSGRTITNNFYQTINITNARFAKDFSPINAYSKLPDLQKYSKACLHYLFKINESLALRLASLNNLEFYLTMLSEIRQLIRQNRF